MTKFVIQTQYLENYGAHTGNGSFKAGGFWWKFKGGSDYLVSGFDRMQDAVAYIAEKYCAVLDVGGKEFPSKWDTYEGWLESIQDYDQDYKDFLVKLLHEVGYKDD